MENINAKDCVELEIDGKNYVVVEKVSHFSSRKGKNVYFDEELQVAIFLVDGIFYGITNICPHQHAAVMADGFIEDLTITCPLHGWIYSLESGKALGGRAKLKTYSVVVYGDEVLLEKPVYEEPKWLQNFI